MNDKTNQDAFEEIFRNADDPDELAEARDDAAAGIADLPLFEDADSFVFDDNQQPAADYAEADEGGTNWAAILAILVLLGAVGGLILSQLQLSRDNQAAAQTVATAASLDSGISGIGYQALLASNGRQDAFAELAALRDQVDNDLALLRNGDAAAGITAAPDAVLGELEGIEQRWLEMKTELDKLLANPGVINSTLSEVQRVNELTPQLLVRTDQVVEKLIQEGASLELINIASRQRFLSQRIKASLNEFASGSPGWEVAATQFGRDVKLFGQINAAIARQGGAPVAGEVRQVSELHDRLSTSADSIMGQVGDYFELRSSAGSAIELSDQLGGMTGDLNSSLSTTARPAIEQRLPWILGAIALIALVVLFVTINRQSKRRAEINARQTRQAEDAVIKLLDEMGDLAAGDLTVQAEVTNEVTGAIADSINFAVEEMRELVRGIQSASSDVNSTTDGTEMLIADLLTSNDQQTEEIMSAAGEVQEMNAAIDRMSASAASSSERARNSAAVAKQGATAVRQTIEGMNNTRNQIQDTAKRLKRLGESSQQINEIVNLIQDVTEQTNVLSLNASIQAAMAGEAGRGFAVVAEEVQRLADRSARASNEITELVQNIQSDANSAIASMETTTEEVVAGATRADEAGQALGEIESVSQDLLDVIDEVATEAAREAEVSKTVTERMDKLKSANEQSDRSVTEVAAALQKMKAVASNLNESIAGFKLPG